MKLTLQTTSLPLERSAALFCGEAGRERAEPEALNQALLSAKAQSGVGREAPLRDIAVLLKGIKKYPLKNSFFSEIAILRRKTLCRKNIQNFTPTFFLGKCDFHLRFCAEGFAPETYAVKCVPQREAWF
jgi:hypothetical protein